jgi:hypothetical protein
MSTEIVTKVSMLELKQEKLRSINRKQLIHSVAIASKLSPNLVDKRDIKNHYEKIFKNCHVKYQGDGPTGILLIYPQHTLHYLEAPIELLNAIITDLNSLDNEGYIIIFYLLEYQLISRVCFSRALFNGSRILNFSTGFEQRFYPQYSNRMVDLPSLAKGEIYQTHEPIEATVSQNLSKIYTMGVQLSKLHQMEMKKTLDALPEKLPHLLVQQDVLEYLVNHEDLNTPSEYIRRYCTPYFNSLDSDFVWPIQAKLFPYD